MRANLWWPLALPFMALLLGTLAGCGQMRTPETAAPGPPAAEEPAATTPAESNKPVIAPEIGGGLTRVVTPVLAELMAGEPRLARQGGSGVVLLSARPQDRNRNLALCRALYRAIDTATMEEVAKGERRAAPQRVELLRPLYWLLARTPAAGADRCAARVDAFDFTRGEALRVKLSLQGAGPYLAILRADDARAAIVDLGAAPIGETDALVAFFERGFSQEADIWDPERPGGAQAVVARFFGADSVLGRLPLAVARIATAGRCPLGDLTDACAP